MSRNISRLNGLGLIAWLVLTLALSACGDTTATPVAFPTPSINPNAKQIIAASPGPVPGAKVNFPLDEAPHDNITEWWYYTGHINSTDGNQYGFEYVIFQGIRGDFPPGYVSHFAISDLNKKDFKYDQKIVAAMKPVQFGGTAGFSLAVNDWTMNGVGGTDNLKAAMGDKSYGIDLTVKDLKGPVLHGGGLFSYGAAGFSYYYSRPRMSVSGTITVDGQPKTIKDGVAWFDHQWGNFIPLSGGWDWFSLHLQDNTELMVYYLRDEQNNVLDVFGSYVPDCGANCNASSGKPVRSVDLHREDFVIKPTGQWTSPINNGIYPSGWNVQVKSPNTPALSLSVQPALQNQELVTNRTTGVTYWEGTSTVSGTKDGQAIAGQAYVELTGYAGKK